MVERQIFFPKAGLAKVQRLPYSMWNDLKLLRNRDAAIEFLRSHPKVEPMFRNGLGPAAKRILETGRTKDKNEAAFADEIIKSCILRAAGSEKAVWAPWNVNKDFAHRLLGEDSKVWSPWNVGREFAYRHLGEESRIEMAHNGSSYSYDMPYHIALAPEIWQKASAAAGILANAVDPKSEKRMLRVDFVLESGNGQSKLWLVDFGESHMTLHIATKMANAVGHQEDFLSQYSERVIGKVKPGQTVYIVAQGTKMIEDFPFEVEAIRLEVEKKDGMPVVLTLSEFLEKSARTEPDSLIIRLFRQATRAEMSLLENSVPATAKYIDPLKFVSSLKKSMVSGMVESARKELSQHVSIPFMRIFAIASPEQAAKEIERSMKDAGIMEVVVKPGGPSPDLHTTAFFYRLDNPHHLDEMTRSLRKISAAKVNSVVVEEMVGAGTVDGRKAEFRFWAFG
jgi:hypothetical protein